ncbi:MAG: hypothetical protein E7A67_06215 [Peptostreptococcus anaerobius]|nr:hypothetical protein [Peptostreptococcus anaerobius]MDU0964600.1 hypothetical protein [Peptostreptococcus anaerobius]MDU0998556.1 hypothetical protein [Peptostreptococcus anaerobius]
MAFLTAAFSVSVKLVLSATSVLVAGFAGSFFSASVFSPGVFAVAFPSSVEIFPA